MELTLNLELLKQLAVVTADLTVQANLVVLEVQVAVTEVAAQQPQLMAIKVDTHQ
jgi:hypothetical protein